MNTINWYPGHMKKTRELIEAHLKLVDIVCEVCDARIPASSRNPIIEELTAGKTRILLLNKSDLADESATERWIEFFRKKEGGAKGFAALAMNAMSGQGVNTLMKRLERIAAEKAASGTTKAGIPVRMLIAGIPNSGKSSLINRLTGRRAAQVGDRPGVTRGKQWLTLENGMQLLDTPGILWPKFEDQQVGLKLAFCGSIRDEIMDIQDLGLELIRTLLADHAGLLTERYGFGNDIAIDEDKSEDRGEDRGRFCVLAEDAEPSPVFDQDVSADEALGCMEAIARKRGFILQGGRIDYERTARMVLDEFRGGKIGRITLETPPK